MEITFFQGLWFMLVFVLIAGYFVLDGFDLGAGVLYPFVARRCREGRRAEEHRRCGTATRCG